MVEAEAREAAARAAALRTKHSFGAVAETFAADKLAKERAGKVIERDFRAYFAVPWRDRPISEITALDVLEVVNAKKRSSPQMARSLLVMLRRFYNWAIAQQVYGLNTSPCDRLSGAKIIGALPGRSRRLTDAEVFAFWRATSRIGYPVGHVYKPAPAHRP